MPVEALPYPNIQPRLSHKDKSYTVATCDPFRIKAQLRRRDLTYYLTSVQIANIQNQNKEAPRRRAEVVFTVENDEGHPTVATTMLVDISYEDGITFGELKEEAIAQATKIIEVIHGNLSAKSASPA
ncbi:hypothetical protein [Methylobacterium sp. WSM2598]|uniref:hypothetical protein n=1 Tax=Methylobacterium sp. WSM2598 TaxID=398261 RepID=UPI0012F67FC7|nr:hypothetical protein [Methylobacterium sp. WSM2598]